VGYHDSDERGQGVHVPADAAGDVDHVAVLQTVAVGRLVRPGPRHDGDGRGHAAGAVSLVLGQMAVHVRPHRVRCVHYVPFGHGFRVLHDTRVRHDHGVQRMVQGAAVHVRVPDGHHPNVRPRHQRSPDHGGRMADVPRPMG